MVAVTVGAYARAVGVKVRSTADFGGLLLLLLLALLLRHLVFVIPRPLVLDLALNILDGILHLVEEEGHLASWVKLWWRYERLPDTDSWGE